MANEPRKNYSASEQLSSETLDEMSQRIHSKVAELAPEITSETSDCVSIIGALLVKEEYLILCHKSKAASDKAFFLMYFNVGPYHRKLQDRMEKPEDEDEVEGEEEVDFGDLDIYAAVWTACFKQLTEFVSEKERLFNGMSFDDAIKAFRKCI